MSEEFFENENFFQEKKQELLNSKSSLRFNPELNLINMQIDLQLYIILTKQIEKDLKNPQNIFYWILDCFFEYFKERFNIISNKKDSYPSIEFKKNVENAIYDIQQFSRIFEQCLSLFYNIDPTKNGLSYFSRENRINFIVGIIFLNEEIYSIIIKLIRHLNFENEEKMKKVKFISFFFINIIFSNFYNKKQILFLIFN